MGFQQECSFIDYKKEQKEDKTLLLLLSLLGIRPNDFLKNPEKYKDHINKLL